MPRSVFPPATIIPWLAYTRSLTEKLNALTGDARLDVLHQSWDKPNSWDKKVLFLDCDQVMHREIAMWSLDSVCWYARTILPISTYQSNKALFERLQNESLGQLIFNSQQIERLSLTHYAISPDSIEYSWLNSNFHEDAPILWVRLSEFQVNHDSSFYLVEILLPGLLRCLS